MYTFDLSGLERILEAKKLTIEEHQFCRSVLGELKKRWVVANSSLEMLPKRVSADYANDRYQRLCRIYVVPENYEIKDMEGKAKGGGVYVEVNGYASINETPKEFHNQVFWGLKFPRGTKAAIDIKGKGLPARIRAFGFELARPVNTQEDGLMGGWNAFGYCVKRQNVATWEAVGGLGKLLDVIAADLGKIYSLVVTTYGKESRTTA